MVPALRLGVARGKVELAARTMGEGDVSGESMRAGRGDGVSTESSGEESTRAAQSANRDGEGGESRCGEAGTGSKSRTGTGAGAGDVSRTESGGKAIGRLRVAGKGNSAGMVGQGSEGEVGVESIRKSGERR